MYVVGADSAASPTRELNGIKSDDTGFEYDWSVVDLANLTPEGLEVADKLGYFQLCTYERPLTWCVASRSRRRGHCKDDAQRVERTKAAAIRIYEAAG